MNIGDQLLTSQVVTFPLRSHDTSTHLILVPLEQLFTSRDSIRKAREAFLIHRGNTLEPEGLNRRDEM